MKLSTNTYLVLSAIMLLLLMQGIVMAQAQSERVEIPSGNFHSVLPEVVGEPQQVESFYLDETAVTNNEYKQFLIENPEWSPDVIPTLYAEKRYLKHWKENLDYGDERIADQPVTRISWYAANAYCGWNGGRLPTLNEWEYAAQAMDFNSPEEANQFSLDRIGWYSAVDVNQTKPVGSTGIENRQGVKDMFGLVMEWVEDFKPPVANKLSLDCGTVGRMQGNSNMYGYAMSIRYITRMSFKATSTTGMLGFRCAYDSPGIEVTNKRRSSAQIQNEPDNQTND